MSKKVLLAAVAATCATAALAAGPFSQFKGKMKEGLYETKMVMEIPGMPAGMGKQTHSMQHCVTAKDIEEGEIGKGKNDNPQKCEIRNFKMSGNTATYTTECKADPKMTADTKITFRNDGYDMDMKMAMDQGGQVMNMTQHMEGRLLGPCKK